MFKHTTTSRPTMSAVTLQKFVLLQENKVLEQFDHHRSTPPAVHRQARARDNNLHAAAHGPSSPIAVSASWSLLAVRLLHLTWFLI